MMKIVRWMLGFVLVAAMLFGEGCATLEHPKPVTVPEILEMCKAEVAAEDIIAKMKASGTVYRLKASQLSQLEKDGVPAAVIDYMQQTYVEAVRMDATYDGLRRSRPYDDYWYGGAPLGWPYERVYMIRERDRHR